MPPTYPPTHTSQHFATQRPGFVSTLQPDPPCHPPTHPPPRTRLCAQQGRANLCSATAAVVCRHEHQPLASYYFWLQGNPTKSAQNLFLDRSHVHQTTGGGNEGARWGSGVGRGWEVKFLLPTTTQSLHPAESWEDFASSCISMLYWELWAHQRLTTWERGGEGLLSISVLYLDVECYFVLSVPRFPISFYFQRFVKYIFSATKIEMVAGCGDKG